jgi:hypothetical protein
MGSDPVTSPETAGPQGDGFKSLAKESRAGLLTSFVLTLLATAALGALDTLDLTTLPGWLTGAATYGVTTLAGTLTAYLKRNR